MDALTVADLGEDALIALFSDAGAPPGREVVVPNGDDAGAWRFARRHASVATTDTLVEGVHFDRAFASPRAVGRKLVAVNLSDLAAMGARPRLALLSLAVPASTPVAVMAELAEGVRSRAVAAGVTILGGNVSRTAGPMVLTATLIGRARPRRLVRRQGAVAGDALFVTGTLGDAAGGLRLALAGVVPGPDDPARALLDALVDPEPEVRAGRLLAATGRVHAMCDLSDGLGRDVRHLLGPAGLGARIEVERLPLSPALRAVAGEEAAALAIGGGEDYRLLLAAPSSSARRLARAAERAGTPLTAIGTVTATGSFEQVAADGSASTLPGGFAHFEGARAAADSGSRPAASRPSSPA
jgi:thiamine-monophosphate kinase